jgi:hypothetical protein
VITTLLISSREVDATGSMLFERHNAVTGAVATRAVAAFGSDANAAWHSARSQGRRPD